MSNSNSLSGVNPFLLDDQHGDLQKDLQTPLQIQSHMWFENTKSSIRNYHLLAN